MEISSGGGDKGEWLAPGEEEGGIVIAYFLFLQEGEGEKKETFVLDRRRYPRWITRITYDFAEFNSNFPGDRRFDLNPRRNFSLRSPPFAHARYAFAVQICDILEPLPLSCRTKHALEKNSSDHLGDIIRRVTRVFNRKVWKLGNGWSP